MSFAAQRTIDSYMAFSVKKQADFATVLADGDLDKVVSLEGFYPPKRDKKYLSDYNFTGRGTEFASPAGHETTIKDAPFDVTLRGSSLMLGWAAAFGMGKVVTSQPDAGGNPTVYKHVCTFFDPLVVGNKDAQISTIYTQLGTAAAFKAKLRAAAVAAFRVTGAPRGQASDIFQLAMTLISSGELVQDPVTVGAPTSVAHLGMNGLVFKIGPQGASMDKSDRLLSFEMAIDQNILGNLGYYPSTGPYRGRHWIGPRRSASFTMRLFLKEDDADVLGWLDGDTLLECSFKSTGALISGIYNHYWQALFPSIRLSQAPVGESDGFMIHEVTVAPDTVYKDAGSTPANTPCEITVQNTEPGYLL